MEVIEQLAKEQQEEGLVEYVRPTENQEKESEVCNKAQEIDLLWQNFKSSTQFNTNSPVALFVFGFIAGIITTVIIFACVNSYFAKHTASGDVLLSSDTVVETTLEEQAQSAEDELQNRVNIPSEEDNVAPQPESAVVEQEVQTPSVDTSKMKKYVVKSGDTGESIIKKHYGSYTPEREKAIIKANNLKTLDRINIDQELWLPMP